MDPVGAALLLALATVGVIRLLTRQQHTGPVHSDERLVRLHQETARILGNPLTRRVKTRAQETERVVTVEKPVDPGEYWSLIPRDPAHPYGALAAVELHRWDRATFRASDPNARARVETAVAYALELASRGEQLHADWGVYGRARFTIIPAPPELPELAPYRPVPQLGATRLPLGVTDPGGRFTWHLPDGTAVAYWDVAEEASHLLVTGRTLAGKSSVIRAVITAALERGWEVVVLDGKGGRGFLYLRGRRGVRAVIREHAAIVQAIEGLCEEMQARYDQDAADADAGRPRRAWRRLLIVVDEYMSVIERVQGREERTRLGAAIGDLARKAREARMHLLFATQRPDVDSPAGKSFPGEARDNFGARLAVGPHSPSGALMVFEEWAEVAQRIPSIRGRAVLRVGDQMTRVQTFWLPDPLDVGGVERARVERLLPPVEAAPATTTAPVVSPPAPPATGGGGGLLPGQRRTLR